MNRVVLLSVSLGVISVGVLATQLVRFARASDQRDSRLDRYHAVQRQVEQYRALSDRSQTRLYGAPPDTDVQAAVVQALRSAGIPEQAASSIRREADREAGDDPALRGVRIRQIRIELSGISVPELGILLRIWKEEQPAWRVIQLTLNKSTRRSSDPTDYDVSMICSARYTDPRGNP